MIGNRGSRWQRKSKIILGIFLGICLVVWICQDKDVESKEAINTGMAGLQFFSADSPYFHYVGRWITTSGGQRKESCFSDSYFEFKFNKSSKLLISLYNNDTATSNMSDRYPAETLVIQSNQFEYYVYEESSGLTDIDSEIVDNQQVNKFRILAPLLRPEHDSCIQFDGIWLDESAYLLPVFDSEIDITPRPLVEVTDYTKPSHDRKWLEIVSDIPGSPEFSGYGHSIQQAAHKTVLKWEYLLGEMFEVDHTTVGVDGMCLVHACIEGTGSPLGIGELYFRSAVFGSKHLTEAWKFPSKAPDVMVFNLGTVDYNSFQTHRDKYNATWPYLSSWFEDSYITLIQSIRNLAYSAGEIELDGFSGFSSHSKSSDMPIFILRPFSGGFEEATRSVVDRLGQQGDSSVFWVDTSGWLETTVDFDKRPDEQDFFLDELGPSKQFRLTERGHQRVAILLHSHVCRFLARDAERCPFLPPGIYDGNRQEDDSGPRFEERETELDWTWN